FEDFLVVGDLLNDVYSALKVGCHAVLVDRYGRYDNVDEIEKKITVISNLKNLPELLHV
ncbi:haloacid dehalogenase, partial [Candidatus Bathyarchaeota archaeon]